MSSRNLYSHFAAISTTALVVLAACTPKYTGSDMEVLGRQMQQMEKKIQYLNDRQQIQDVYLRYMRGFDRGDVELMRSAFWPEVQINYAKQSNTFDEFVKRHLEQHLATLITWSHLLTNQTVDIDGDTAHVEITVTRLASRKEDGKSDIISGRYIDRLDRRNGEWRIVVREFIPHFFTETNVSLKVKPGWAQSGCALGTRDKRDPSYRRPLVARVDKAVGPACAE